MKKVLIIALAAIVILLAVGYIAVNYGRGSDEDQIIGVIENGRQAIQKKSLSAANSCISKDYSDEYGLNADRIKFFASQAFRSKSQFEVVVDTPQIQINGDQAEAKTHVSLTVINTEERHEAFSGDVVIHLKKDKAHRYLIYPVRVWKVTEMTGLGKILDFVE